MRRRWLLTSVTLSALGTTAIWMTTSRGMAGDAPSTQPAVLALDLNRAVSVSMPEAKKELSPEAFKTPDGRDGWVVRIPGARPIATPAYADGLLFVGGGYGSHEFYALDADSGAVRWKLQTGDDGPTAAVVEDGYVAFNTESCTVIIADAKTGKLVWQEWLGDPLMSQPAISKGKLFIAYPGGHPRGAAQNGAGNTAPNPSAGGAAPNAEEDVQKQVAAPTNNSKDAGHAVAAAVGPAKGNGHRLLCADLKTGHHVWEQDITADVISAPIVDGDQVFLTCFDGTSFCLKAADGAVVWKKENAGTSAPTIADGQVVMTQKQMQGKNAREGIARLDSARGGQKDAQLLASGKAEYLEKGKGGNVGLSPANQQAQDSSVGFSTAPAAAGLAKASTNVNVNTVVGGWAYQGSRAAYANGQILNAQGVRLNCLRASDGHVAWQAEASGKSVNRGEQVFVPPAAGAANLYVCSTRGHLLSLSQKDGTIAFLYATDQPMSFQPALARGNVYAGTNNGMVICLKTGGTDADGWTAWGGNAQHNKKN